jgi:peptidoglycan/LPS O-acetylase OafA/YrhL
MSRTNNFDVLRLILASIVVLAHCFDLSREPALSWVGDVISSRVAVEGFFAMSGFLIVASYDRSSSLRSYLTKRARRILPAYWAACGFAIVLGAVMSALPVLQYISSASTWKYVAATLSFATFLHPSLPGVFADNPTVGAVNGALWTIKVEVMFYLAVPVVAWLCRRVGRYVTLGSIFAASIAYRVICETLGRDSLAMQLPGQMAFFVVGALVHYHRTEFAKYARWMWTLGGAAYLGDMFVGFIAFRAVGIAVLTLCVVLLVPPLKGPTKYGDFSYGAYVFHFPIVQTCVALGLFRVDARLGVATVACCVAGTAVFSWFVIERRWLEPAVLAAPRPQLDASSKAAA